MIFSRYLDTNGDGTGTKNANGDYSLAAEEFYIQPATGETLEITRLLVHIRDSAINADDYGAISGGLTNGVTVKVVNDSGTIVDLTDEVTVKTSAHWARSCFDAVPQTWGAGDEFLSVRWTFTKSGEPITLRNDTGGKDGIAVDYENERLVVTLNDNLGGLVEHYFLVQGNK